MRLYGLAAFIILCAALFCTAAPNSVFSVFGRTGNVRAVAGDYNTSLVPELGSNQYFNPDRARASISAEYPIVFDVITGTIACPTCGSGGGTVSVVSPLVYDPLTNTISCPTCATLDTSGNLVVPGSVKAQQVETTGTGPGTITLGLPDGFICSSNGVLISKPTPCQ